jgi:hypothetical protein
MKMAAHPGAAIDQAPVYQREFDQAFSIIPTASLPERRSS